MKACKKFQNMFIEALYGELEEYKLKDLQAHLETCSACREAYSQMQNTTKQMDKNITPDPGQDFWNNYWDNLEQRMSREVNIPNKKTGLHNIFTLHPQIQTWTVRILSAAALLLTGIGIGYLYFGNPEPGHQTVNTNIPVEKTAYPQAAADYLERSKILLLGFVNFDTDAVDPTSMDFSRQQQTARSLVQQAAVLEDDLKGRENQRVLALVKQLEIILLQISNCEKEFDIPAIELIKSGVDNNALLMKINLEEIMRVDSDENNQTQQNKPAKKNRQEL
jgi:hypothetical protein